MLSFKWLDLQGQGAETILDVDGQGRRGRSWKLDNFHEGHVYIIPNILRIHLP